MGKQIKYNLTFSQFTDVTNRPLNVPQRGTLMRASAETTGFVANLSELPMRPAPAIGLWLFAAAALWTAIGALSIGLVNLF
jgi:hypothetical protein